MEQESDLPSLSQRTVVHAPYADLARAAAAAATHFAARESVVSVANMDREILLRDEQQALDTALAALDSTHNGFLYLMSLLSASPDALDPLQEERLQQRARVGRMLQAQRERISEKVEIYKAKWFPRLAGDDAGQRHLLSAYLLAEEEKLHGRVQLLEEGSPRRLVGLVLIEELKAARSRISENHPQKGAPE